MSAKIEFFPVGNGDTTLVTLEGGKKILIDLHVRKAENPDEDIFDVVEALKERLDRDDKNRLFIDAFLLSHPDQDHILGLEEHFHLGPIEDWKEDDDKIVIKEMWSSPIIFRRLSKSAEAQGLSLCDDAKAWWVEARRRVTAFRNGNGTVEGNRILIMGADVVGKEDGLESICVPLGDSFNRIGGEMDTTFSADLLGPLPPQEEEEAEEALAKNRSSVIMRFHIKGGDDPDACVFFATGDAEVLVWEKLWEKHKEDLQSLSYDIMQTPHHCSLHSLSYGSWSNDGEKVVISKDAYGALSQANSGAYIVASSKPISDDDSDPPCVRAAQEYKEISKNAGGEFLCVSTHHGKGDTRILAFDISDNGPSLSKSASIGPITGGTSPRPLTPPSREFDKQGGGRYA